MADTDDQDLAPTENVMGNLPSTRPGRRSTRREGSDGPAADGTTAAAARGGATKRSPSTAGTRKAKPAAATAKPAAGAKPAVAKAKPGAGASKAKPAAGAKAGTAKASAGAAKAKPTAAKAKPTTGKPKAGASKAKAGGAKTPAAGAGSRTARGTRRVAAPAAEAPTPEQAPVPQAPRSGWATPAEDAQEGGGLSVGSLVGEVTKQGESLVRGVLKRLGRG